MGKVGVILGTMTFGESVFSPQVGEFINTFLDAGFEELDTAYVYNEGNCERLLGEELPLLNRPFKISTKVNPRISGKLDGAAAYKQVNESLERLKIEQADTVYLHFPDPATPVISVLEAMNELYRQGKYRELGLSNYPAWMVSDVWHICDQHGWIRPTVYEGMYNPIARKAETELDDCLSHFRMRFYAYNPLAGGLLTGRYRSFESTPEDGRFTHRANYQGRYWKKSCFQALEIIAEAAEKFGISSTEASLRWLMHHSMLKAERGDAVILGASKREHLVQNLEAVKKGPLSEEVREAFFQAWDVCRKDSPAYFTLYRNNH